MLEIFKAKGEHMLTRTKMVGKKGEILIPKELREKSGIQPKQKVELISSKNGILIVPLVNDVKQLRGLFKKEGYKHEKDIDSVLFKLMAGL